MLKIDRFKKIGPAQAGRRPDVKAVLKSLNVVNVRLNKPGYLKASNLRKVSLNEDSARLSRPSEGLFTLQSIKPTFPRN